MSVLPYYFPGHMPQRQKREEQLLFLERGPHITLGALPGSERTPKGPTSLRAPAGASARAAVQSAGLGGEGAPRAAGQPPAPRRPPLQDTRTWEPARSRAVAPCPRCVVPHVHRVFCVAASLCRRLTSFQPRTVPPRGLLAVLLSHPPLHPHKILLAPLVGGVSDVRLNRQAAPTAGGLGHVLLHSGGRHSLLFKEFTGKY